MKPKRSSKTRTARVTRVDASSCTEREEQLAVEQPLQVIINDQTFCVAMRTPGDDECLVRGLLFTEGIVSQEGLHPDVCALHLQHEDDSSTVEVKIPEVYLCKDLVHKRSLIMNASCGFCSKKELGDIEVEGDALRPPRPFDVAMLPHLYKAMAARQDVFQETGGSHAAAVFTLEGELLGLFEDVGRHNAVDKCVGWLIEQEKMAEAAVLLVSGRISYEIVAKAYRAALPFLAGVSAASSLAVTRGQELGMTILGFCRDDRATIYSNHHNVSGHVARHE